MNRFIEALAAAKLDGTYIRWLNQIAKTPLLILDDFGLKLSGLLQIILMMMFIMAQNILTIIL